jgi:hypothetical protein
MPQRRAARTVTSSFFTSCPAAQTGRTATVPRSRCGAGAAGGDAGRSTAEVRSEPVAGPRCPQSGPVHGASTARVPGTGGAPGAPRSPAPAGVPGVAASVMPTRRTESSCRTAVQPAPAGTRRHAAGPGLRVLSSSGSGRRNAGALVPAGPGLLPAAIAAPTWSGRAVRVRPASTSDRGRRPSARSPPVRRPVGPPSPPSTPVPGLMRSRDTSVLRPGRCCRRRPCVAAPGLHDGSRPARISGRSDTEEPAGRGERVGPDGPVTVDEVVDHVPAPFIRLVVFPPRPLTS